MHIASYFISVSCTVQSISLIVANKSLPEPCTEQIPDPSWGTSQASSLLEMVLDWAVSIADKKREPICIMRVKEGVPKVSQELPPTLPPTLTCSAPSIASPPPPPPAPQSLGHPGPSTICHRAQGTEAKAHLGACILREPPQTPDWHPLLLRWWGRHEGMWSAFGKSPVEALRSPMTKEMKYPTSLSSQAFKEPAIFLV